MHTSSSRRPSVWCCFLWERLPHIWHQKCHEHGSTRKNKEKHIKRLGIFPTRHQCPGPHLLPPPWPTRQLTISQIWSTTLENSLPAKLYSKKSGKPKSKDVTFSDSSSPSPVPTTVSFIHQRPGFFLVVTNLPSTSNMCQEVNADNLIWFCVFLLFQCTRKWNANIFRFFGEASPPFPGAKKNVFFKLWIEWA